MRIKKITRTINEETYRPEIDVEMTIDLQTVIDDKIHLSTEEAALKFYTAFESSFNQFHLSNIKISKP